MLVHVYEQNISSINILITRPTGNSLIARLIYHVIFYIVLNFLYFYSVFRRTRHWTLSWNKRMKFASSHRIQIFFRYYFPIYIYVSLMASSLYVFRPRLFAHPSSLIPFQHASSISFLGFIHLRIIGEM
jgi:hypothetical protein